jgi:hypothetical protein
MADAVASTAYCIAGMSIDMQFHIDVFVSDAKDIEICYRSKKYLIVPAPN